MDKLLGLLIISFYFLTQNTIFNTKLGFTGNLHKFLRPISGSHNQGQGFIIKPHCFKDEPIFVPFFTKKRLMNP